jgi:hypothetical protein
MRPCWRDLGLLRQFFATNLQIPLGSAAPELLRLFQPGIPVEYHAERTIADLRGLGVDDETLAVGPHVIDTEPERDAMCREKHVGNAQLQLLSSGLNRDSDQIAIMRIDKEQFLAIGSPPRTAPATGRHLISVFAARKAVI